LSAHSCAFHGPHLAFQDSHTAAAAAAAAAFAGRVDANFERLVPAGVLMLFDTHQGELGCISSLTVACGNGFCQSLLVLDLPINSAVLVVWVSFSFTLQLVIIGPTRCPGLGMCCTAGICKQQKQEAFNQSNQGNAARFGHAAFCADDLSTAELCIVYDCAGR
jgi:hypothetical protein